MLNVRSNANVLGTISPSVTSEEHGRRATVNKDAKQKAFCSFSFNDFTRRTFFVCPSVKVEYLPDMNAALFSQWSKHIPASLSLSLCLYVPLVLLYRSLFWQQKQPKIRVVHTEGSAAPDTPTHHRLRSSQSCFKDESLVVNINVKGSPWLFLRLF